MPAEGKGAFDRSGEPVALPPVRGVLRIWGIPLSVHPSFPQLAFLVSLFVLIATPDLEVAARHLLSLGSILLALLLHEFGHAFVARIVGVPVLDVRLHALFGQTRMLRPQTASQELAVAAAGPLTNLALALPLWIYFAAAGEARLASIGISSPLTIFAAANAALGLLNLFPAFPMDGGRILRALCWRAFGADRAFRIAIFTGRALSGVLISMALLAPIDPRFLGFSIAGLLVLSLNEQERRRVLQLRQAAADSAEQASAPSARNESS